MQFRLAEITSGHYTSDNFYSRFCSNFYGPLPMGNKWTFTSTPAEKSILAHFARPRGNKLSGFKRVIAIADSRSGRRINPNASHLFQRPGTEEETAPNPERESATRLRTITIIDLYGTLYHGI